MNKTNKNFQGSVDALLNHIDSIDLSTLDNDIDVENAVQKIMKETGESHETIMEALNEAHLQEVQETLNKLMAEGFVKISGYNEDGEPLYISTQKI
jgi:hypothetical protein